MSRSGFLSVHVGQSVLSLIYSIVNHFVLSHYIETDMHVEKNQTVVQISYNLLVTAIFLS